MAEDDDFENGVQRYTGHEVTCEDFVNHVIVAIDGLVRDESDEMVFKLEAHQRACEECEQRVELALKTLGIDCVEELDARQEAHLMNDRLEQERQRKEQEQLIPPTEV